MSAAASKTETRSLAAMSLPHSDKLSKTELSRRSFEELIGGFATLTTGTTTASPTHTGTLSVAGTSPPMYPTPGPLRPRCKYQFTNIFSPVPTGLTISRFLYGTDKAERLSSDSRAIAPTERLSSDSRAVAPTEFIIHNPTTGLNLSLGCLKPDGPVVWCNHIYEPSQQWNVIPVTGEGEDTCYLQHMSSHRYLSVQDGILCLTDVPATHWTIT